MQVLAQNEHDAQASASIVLSSSGNFTAGESILCTRLRVVLVFPPQISQASICIMLLCPGFIASAQRSWDPRAIRSFGLYPQSYSRRSGLQAITANLLGLFGCIFCWSRLLFWCRIRHFLFCRFAGFWLLGGRRCRRIGNVFFGGLLHFRHGGECGS
jgi:hypothetical protein